MSSAGQRLLAGRIPGEVIGTPTEITADSATFTTTETTVASVTVPLVSGRKYLVHWYGHGNSSTGTDEITFRLREDNSTGTEMQTDRASVNGSTTSGERTVQVVDYTAASTANKTFVATGTRVGGGAGNCFLEAASNRPARLWVTYESG